MLPIFVSKTTHVLILVHEQKINLKIATELYILLLLWFNAMFYGCVVFYLINVDVFGQYISKFTYISHFVSLYYY